MGQTGAVTRGTSDLEPFHYLPVAQMLINDLVNVVPVRVGIPSAFGIHRNHRAFGTAIHTPGTADTDLPFTGNPQGLYLLLGVVPHGLGFVVAAAGATILTQVGAEKHMVAVIGHSGRYKREVNDG